MKVGIVIWHDAHADSAESWTSITPSTDDKPFEVVTVGIILDSKTGRKKGHVTVAQSLTQSEHVDHLIHIPKRMVVDIIELFEIGVSGETIELDTQRSTDRSRLSEKSRRTRRT